MRISSGIKSAELLGDILTLIKLADKPMHGVTLHIDRFATAPNEGVRAIIEEGGEVYGKLQSEDKEPMSVTILGVTRKNRRAQPREFHVPYRQIQAVDVQFK